MKHVKLTTVSMKSHPEINERWVQNVIAADPQILGLGDLVLIDKERTQHSGGRIDLLFREGDGGTRRYETELQLGATDETHIIRTIEYWDIERRRYPQIDHVGVLIAEHVTSRFLNVISLFNGFIPLIALQMTAVKTGDGVGLHFTKVVDWVPKGLPEDEGASEPANRAYWESKASAKTVKIADEIEQLCQIFDPTLKLNYNKPYIGFTRDGLAFNFATCNPRKSALNLAIKIPRDETVDARLEQSGLDLLEYARWGAYRIKLEPADVGKHKDLLLELLQTAFENRQ